MSGVNRAIKAENVHAGRKGEAALAQFTPEKIRTETGRSVHSSAPKGADKGEYLGKNGRDATPKK